MSGAAGHLALHLLEIMALAADGRVTVRRPCRRAMDIDGMTQASSVHPDGAGTGWIAWFGPPVSAAETARLYPGAHGFRCPYGHPGERRWIRDILPAGLTVEVVSVTVELAERGWEWVIAVKREQTK